MIWVDAKIEETNSLRARIEDTIARITDLTAQGQGPDKGGQAATLTNKLLALRKQLGSLENLADLSVAELDALFGRDIRPVFSRGMCWSTAPTPELYYFPEGNRIDVEARFARGSNEHAFVEHLLAENERVRREGRAHAMEIWTELEDLKAAQDPFVAALAELVRAHFGGGA